MRKTKTHSERDKDKLRDTGTEREAHIVKCINTKTDTEERDIYTH